MYYQQFLIIPLPSFITLLAAYPDALPIYDLYYCTLLHRSYRCSIFIPLSPLISLFLLMPASMRCQCAACNCLVIDLWLVTLLRRLYYPATKICRRYKSLWPARFALCVCSLPAVANYPLICCHLALWSRPPLTYCYQLLYGQFRKAVSGFDVETNTKVVHISV